jgi:PIN domain nuclease of toxin-antitoxin system
VNILLDTHAWLWMMIEPKRIGRKTRALVADRDNTFRLSVASIWELAIKHAAGRLVLPEEPLAYVRTASRSCPSRSSTSARRRYSHGTTPILSIGSSSRRPWPRTSCS